MALPFCPRFSTAWICESLLSTKFRGGTIGSGAEKADFGAVYEACGSENGGSARTAGVCTRGCVGPFSTVVRSYIS